MRASRGMGAINPGKTSKGKKILRKDALTPVEVFKKGGVISDKSRPPKRVKTAGGGYPNLIDNTRVMK